MPFFMLFEVTNDLKKEDLDRKLCAYGDLSFSKLTPDRKKPDKQFGQIDFLEIHDKQALAKYFKSICKFFKETDSKENLRRKNICQKKQRQNGDRERKPKQRSKTSIENMGFWFYRQVYGKGIQEFDAREILAKSADLLSIEHGMAFELTTTYPGLLVGAGYAHPKLKESNDDFQLGLFFDHTTGLPVIPGSSIKGVLRSVAPIDGDEETRKRKRTYMKSIYEIDDATVDAFCRLFDDGETIFFDAFPVKTEDDLGRIFADDYITPHGDGITEEPNPIRFLKIRSGVTFLFQFKAEEWQKDLFEKILLDRGIGAKTNVGYGQFEATD